MICPRVVSVFALAAVSELPSIILMYIMYIFLPASAFIFIPLNLFYDVHCIKWTGRVPDQAELPLAQLSLTS